MRNKSVGVGVVNTNSIVKDVTKFIILVIIMSEKRYFKVEYDEEWYLFDSNIISEELVTEQAEYGYGVFANSLSPSEICELLNSLNEEKERLKEENEQLRRELDCFHPVMFQDMRKGTVVLYLKKVE